MSGPRTLTRNPSRKSVRQSRVLSVDQSPKESVFQSYRPLLNRFASDNVSFQPKLAIYQPREGQKMTVVLEIGRKRVFVRARNRLQNRLGLLRSVRGPTMSEIAIAIR
jgi:hypothetical protein